jgi:hypothetical protein
MTAQRSSEPAVEDGSTTEDFELERETDILEGSIFTHTVAE